jgi:hypothetical protein
MHLDGMMLQLLAWRMALSDGSDTITQLCVEYFEANEGPQLWGSVDCIFSM